MSKDIKKNHHTLEVREGMAVSRHHFGSASEAVLAAKALLAGYNIRVMVYPGIHLYEKGTEIYRAESPLDYGDLNRERA